MPYDISALGHVKTAFLVGMLFVLLSSQRLKDQKPMLEDMKEIAIRIRDAQPV